MRVGYARVSTTNREQDISIDGQIQQLEKAGCDRVIHERASAYKGERRGYEELWSLVASGQVKEVLVVDQSRLSRSGDDLQFLAICANHRTKVRALSGGEIEAESYQGFVVTGVQSIFNQAQSKLTGIKVKEGLNRRKAAGHYGCGRVPYGFAYVDGLVVPHPENWDKARQMVLELIACEMNVNGYIRRTRCNWTPAGIRGWIRKPMLRGVVPYQAEGVKPLISPEEWQQLQRLMALRSRSPVRVKGRDRLLTGLVRCQSCQKNLKYKSIQRGAERLHCANPNCDWYGRGVAIPLIRAQVCQALIAAAFQMQQAVQQASAATDRAESSECIEEKAKLAQLEQLQESGVTDLERSIDTLRQQIAAMTEPVIGPDWAGLAELLAVPGMLERFPDAELRRLLIEYVERMEYTGSPRQIEIILR